jgi:hypothetical protein
MRVDENDHVADITLERYRLKELPADATARLEHRLEADEGLRRRLEVLCHSDEAIRSSDRLQLMASAVRSRLDANRTTAERQRWMAISRWAVPAAVAAGIALLVIPRMTSVPAQEDERIKGLQPSLTLFRCVGAGSETLADGAVAHQGDLIRVGYHAAGRAYGVILSIDGRGHVTVHLPPDGDRATPLGREPTVLLDQAFELDDAPRWERFYFITGREPFSVAPIVAAAQRAVALTQQPGAAAAVDPPLALTLSAGLEQSVFSLQKEAKP